MCREGDDGRAVLYSSSGTSERLQGKGGTTEKRNSSTSRSHFPLKRSELIAKRVARWRLAVCALRYIGP